MPAYREQLEHLERVKRFGESRGLRFGAAFTQTDFSGAQYVWLVASRKDRLDSVFRDPHDPRWGCPAYFGTDANAAARIAQAMPLHDTYLRKAEAQGGEDCRITRPLLDATRARRTNVVLHEGLHLTHARLGIHVPYPLEEAIACYIGSRGSAEFAGESPGDDDNSAVVGIDDHLRFSAAFNERYDELERAYASGDAAAVAKARTRFAPIGNMVDNAVLIAHRFYTEFFPQVWTAMRAVPIKDYLGAPQQYLDGVLDRIGS